ncbi:low-density lipoprotein receptor-related protein 2-like [Hydra vulgaris]|uniref:Low-density lipoprotein receptor-related protein 2-like n=1 Tax=Hydra vulgaris TaxID=6087 RepID=A0ABM4CA65_HYDVU
MRHDQYIQVLKKRMIPHTSWSDPCWYKDCSQECKSNGLSANCSCYYGYILQPNGKTCLRDPCRDKGCSQKCNTYGSSAICSCHYEYFLLPDGKTCLHGSQLSGASIVLITFGVIFLLFLFAFSFAICHQRKRKLKAVTVRFNTATQSAVVQGLAQNQINNVDIQTGVDNAVISNILLTSNEMGIDNMAHIGTAPPIYEPLAQQLSVSVVFGNDPPPEYSN